MSALIDRSPERTPLRTPACDDAGAVAVAAAKPLAADPVTGELSQETIDALIEAGRTLEQAPTPVRHLFAPGIYIREMFMARGLGVIGAKHRTDHFNIVLAGRARVWMAGAWVLCEAGMTIRSGAGVQKILEIEEDCVWQTIHANPGDCQDVPTLEERLFEFSEEFRAEMGGRPLEEFRMSADFRRPPPATTHAP